MRATPALWPREASPTQEAFKRQHRLRLAVGYEDGQIQLHDDVSSLLSQDQRQALPAPRILHWCEAITYGSLRYRDLADVNAYQDPQAPAPATRSAEGSWKHVVAVFLTGIVVRSSRAAVGRASLGEVEIVALDLLAWSSDELL